MTGRLRKRAEEVLRVTVTGRDKEALGAVVNEALEQGFHLRYWNPVLRSGRFTGSTRVILERVERPVRLGLAPARRRKPGAVAR